MQKDPRILPRQITRFNYWEYFRPGGLATTHVLQDYIRSQFHFQLSALRDRPFDVLKDYVADDKEWRSDKTAQEVLKQLSPQQRTAIQRLDRATWSVRSKRPARLKRTWKTLMEDIAHDQDTFERFCDVRPAADEMSGTQKRIYLAYNKQAIKLLGGGGTYIHLAHRSKYQAPNPLDESDNPTLTTLLNSRGRIDSPSIIDGVDWLKCTSNEERREAKKRTIHWFHHALRNLREYYYRRGPVPWTAECEQTCRDIQKKLLTAKS